VINLDLTTLMAMESFVALCAALFLIYAWWQNRQRALLMWACNGLLVAAGILCILFAVANDAPILFAVANLLLGLSGGLIWAAARIFSGKTAPIAIIAIPAILSPAVGIVAAVAGHHSAAAGLPLLIGPVFLILAARTFVLDRQEALAARWPMVGLLTLHAALLIAGGLSFVTGFSAPSVLGPLGTVFGLIHFESIVFSIGSAVFFLAMNKERTELTSRRAAHTDGLTGIANRRSFMEGAERVFNRCRRDGGPMALVMFDLDRFKGINDAYGHGTGDQVIQHFARVARDALRPTDLFGRIGGEEFAMALPGADIDAAFARADRIRIEFSRATFAAGEEVVTATVSAGVATAGERDTLTMLLAEADGALYRAKAEGRNRVTKAASSGKDRSVLRVA
jgi:diguanylate cyclase (GGDEF)-like protein